jgi:hypothetical protein
MNGRIATIDVDSAGRLRVQQCTVRQFMEQRRNRSQKRHDAEQLKHQRAAPDADPRRMIGAPILRLRADEKSTDESRRAGQHQQFHRNPKARRFARLDQQQAHKAGGVEHHAHQSRPNTGVAFRWQDRERVSVGSNSWSYFRH